MLLSLVVFVWIGASFHTQVARSQLPDPGSILESKDPPKEKSVRPISEWIEAVKQRLAEAKSLLSRAKESEDQPASAIVRQVELLDRLELTLAQVASAEADVQTATTNRDEAQTLLEEFLLQGLSASEASSFLLLDSSRDQIDDAKQRLRRLKERERLAVQELEKARTEYEELEKARRIAKDALDANDGDAKRISLNQKHAVATLEAEIAEATVRRRVAELKSARLAREAQSHYLKLLEEKVQVLTANARFDQSELNSLIQVLEQQAEKISNRLSEANANNTRRKYFEEQWMRTQRELDSPTGDKDILHEELLAYQLGRSNLDEHEEILKSALHRLKDSQEVWKRRQQLFAERPERRLISTWEEENEKSLSHLASEQRTAKGKLDDLRNQLKATTKQLSEAEEGSEKANWLAQQVSALEGLISTQEENLQSIESALELQSKLARQLQTDSLTETAREQLSEFWDKLEDFWNAELGAFEQPLTVQKVVKALLLFFVGFLIARVISRWLGKYLLGRMEIDASGAATVQSLSFYLLIVLFTLLALSVVRVPLTAFTVLGGAVALGIGFGSQNIINNFISGLILHAERPVKIGDLIQIGDLYGNVEHIGARSTRIRTGDNLEIIVPNSKFLQDNVVNFTLSSDKMRTHVTVGVAYGSPVIEVTQLLKRAVVETGRASKEPPPIVLFQNFGDNALEFEVHFWVRMRTMMDRRQIESAVRYQIVQLFAESGITVAFPQRDVHLNTTSPLFVQLNGGETELLQSQGPQ